MVAVQVVEEDLVHAGGVYAHGVVVGRGPGPAVEDERVGRPSEAWVVDRIGDHPRTHFDEDAHLRLRIAGRREAGPHERDAQLVVRERSVRGEGLQVLEVGVPLGRIGRIVRRARHPRSRGSYEAPHGQPAQGQPGALHEASACQSSGLPFVRLLHDPCSFRRAHPVHGPPYRNWSWDEIRSWACVSTGRDYDGAATLLLHSCNRHVEGRRRP